MQLQEEDITRPMSLPSGAEEVAMALRELAESEDRLAETLAAKGTKYRALHSQSRTFATTARTKAQELERRGTQF